MRGLYPHEPEIIYVQYDKNTCVLSCMYSTLFDANENVAKHAVVSRLSSQLSCDTVCFVNRIKFASDILIDCFIN